MTRNVVWNIVCWYCCFWSNTSNTATAWSSFLGRFVRKKNPSPLETDKSSSVPSSLPPSSSSSLPWYKDGLSFSCTGCGKCCTMDGDVWLSPEEQPRIAEYLGETVETFREKYTRDRPIRNWVCLKYQKDILTTITTATTTSSPLNENNTKNPQPLPNNQHGCIFLSDMGQCRIYEHRPIQCRTYPFWPSLLEDRESWESEAVLPDHIPLSSSSSTTESSSTSSYTEVVLVPNRHWSMEEGGCEGIHHVNATIIPLEEIERQRKETQQHWKQFPNRKIKHDTWYL
jgi:uncharacterized protein